MAVLGVAAFGIFASARLIHQAKVGPRESSRTLAYADPADWNQFYDSTALRRRGEPARTSVADVPGRDVDAGAGQANTPPGAQATAAGVGSPEPQPAGAAEVSEPTLGPPLSLVPELLVSPQEAEPDAAGAPVTNPSDEQRTAAIAPQLTAPPNTGPSFERRGDDLAADMPEMQANSITADSQVTRIGNAPSAEAPADPIESAPLQAPLAPAPDGASADASTAIAATTVVAEALSPRPSEAGASETRERQPTPEDELQGTADADVVASLPPAPSTRKGTGRHPRLVPRRAATKATPKPTPKPPKITTVVGTRAAARAARSRPARTRQATPLVITQPSTAQTGYSISIPVATTRQGSSRANVGSNAEPD
jgi:hypothetical protein